MCIPPRARANVLGIVNAMASAIVVYFMVVSFVVYVGYNRTLTIKFFFSAIEAAKETQLLPVHGWTRPPQLAASFMCAEYERQLGGGSPLSSLMTAKG
jgi:hypothetical protein